MGVRESQRRPASSWAHGARSTTPVAGRDRARCGGDGQRHGNLLERADFIGSTAALLKYVENDNADAFIVVTEPGIIHQMQKRAPQKQLIPAPPDGNCACNICPHMARNTLEKLRDCITLDNVCAEICIEDTDCDPAYFCDSVPGSSEDTCQIRR